MLATLLPRYICIARVEFLWCCMQQQLQEQRLYTCHMHTYIRTTSMTATSSCSTAKLLQFVCKIVLQIEQERWRKQKAQSLLHTYTLLHVHIRLEVGPKWGKQAGMSHQPRLQRQHQLQLQKGFSLSLSMSSIRNSHRHSQSFLPNTL